MCNDEARNVVIYILNANIHVYIQEDLNEIYLYNVKVKKGRGTTFFSWHFCVFPLLGKSVWPSRLLPARP
jgi:hypothetical protein